MFQMNCSNCGEVIRSKQLIELQVTKCPHCKDIVGVMNVAVASKKAGIRVPSSIKSILLAARKNFHLNKSNLLEEGNHYIVDKRLAKLLRRDDFRIDLTYDIYVQINFNSHKRLVKLLNISPSGAAVEFVKRSREPESSTAISSQLPENNSVVSFLLPLPGGEKSLQLQGRVVWSRIPTIDTIFPSIPMGIEFNDIDEAVRGCLWDFIANAELSASEST